MTDKELKKLGRRGLLRLLREQELEIQELKAECSRWREAALDKKLRLKDAGDLGEASVRVTHLFEKSREAFDEIINTAQEAADLYMANLREQFPEGGTAVPEVHAESPEGTKEDPMVSGYVSVESEEEVLPEPPEIVPVTPAGSGTVEPATGLPPEEREYADGDAEDIPEEDTWEGTDPDSAEGCMDEPDASDSLLSGILGMDDGGEDTVPDEETEALVSQALSDLREEGAGKRLVAGSRAVLGDDGHVHVRGDSPEEKVSVESHVPWLFAGLGDDIIPEGPEADAEDEDSAGGTEGGGDPWE